MFSFLIIARRLEKEVKQVLDEISHDQAAKERLIRGRQVDLAEELSEENALSIINQPQLLPGLETFSC